MDSEGVLTILDHEVGEICTPQESAHLPVSELSVKIIGLGAALQSEQNL